MICPVVGCLKVCYVIGLLSVFLKYNCIVQIRNILIFSNVFVCNIVSTQVDRNLR